MHLFKTWLFIFTSLLLVNTKVAAQKNDADSTEKEKNYWKISGNYLSNAVYSGRKDSVVVPYTGLSIGYNHRSGLSFGGSISYENNTKVVDLLTIDGGYDFSIGKKVSASIYGSKYFYSSSSVSVRSNTKGSAGADISVETNWLTFSAGTYLMFGDNTDVGLSANVSHNFTFGEDDGFYVTPTLYAGLGSQHFYQAHTKKRGKKGAVSAIEVQNQPFGILAYEVSAPLGYDGSNWGLSFTPTYAIAKNPLTTTTTYVVTLPNNNTVKKVVTETEKLSNTFYFELKFYYKINLH